MIKQSFTKYDHVFKFKAKKHKNAITEQDKNHVRIIAICKLHADGNIKELLTKEFTEKFIFDVEDQTIYYLIKYKRKGIQYADS